MRRGYSVRHCWSCCCWSYRLWKTKKSRGAGDGVDRRMMILILMMICILRFMLVLDSQTRRVPSTSSLMGVAAFLSLLKMRMICQTSWGRGFACTSIVVGCPFSFIMGFFSHNSQCERKKKGKKKTPEDNLRWLLFGSCFGEVSKYWQLSGRSYKLWQPRNILPFFLYLIAEDLI